MADRKSCTHPVQMAGMCAVCGKELDTNALQQTSLSMMHSNATVKVSEDEARRLDHEATAHLLSQRKLALVVDLDQTIIHATVDPTVADWHRDADNPNNEALKDLRLFKLGPHGDAVDLNADDSAPGCWYYVKPRPGLYKFLLSLSQRYEMHVYTMGTRSYANCVCKVIDPVGIIFGNRILSRDENGSLVRKSLSRLFPVDTSMVVIIDDRADVWNYSPNLIKVSPFDFFVGIGDINASFLPPPPPFSSGPPLPNAADKSNTAASPSVPSSSASSGGDSSAAEASKPTDLTASAGSPPEDGEAKPSQEAVALLAAQSQQLEDLLSEQRKARPLAKMQEALDEKLGTNVATASDGGKDAPVDENGSDGAGSRAPNGSENGGADTQAPNAGVSKTDAVASDVDPATPAETHSTNEQATATATATGEGESAPPSSNGGGAASDGGSSNGNGTASNGSAAKQQAVLRTDDTELQRLQVILDDIHAKWYAQYDAGKQSSKDSTDQAKAAGGWKPNVQELIAERKAQVLRGCCITFSNMMPNNIDPSTADVWKRAEEYGATCVSNLTKSVTHVVGSRPFTVKVMRALALPSVSVVWPDWLHESIAKEERQPEARYLMPTVETSRNPHAQDGWDEPANGETSSGAEDAGGEDKAAPEEDRGVPNDDGAMMSGFAAMDWAEAADEVDQFLDDDSEADEESEADSESEARSKRGPTTPRKDKRQRSEAGSDADDDGEDENGDEAARSLLLRSPLSKRRKRTEDRMGQSKLKQSVTGEDLVHRDSDGDDDNDSGADQEPGRRQQQRQQQQQERRASQRSGARREGGRRSRLATPVGAGDETGTDTGSIDESFLDDLANEMELQMDEDEHAASHSDDE